MRGFLLSFVKCIVIFYMVPSSCRDSLQLQAFYSKFFWSLRSASLRFTATRALCGAFLEPRIHENSEIYRVTEGTE